MSRIYVGILELASKYRYGMTSRGAPMYLFKPYDPTGPDLIVGSTHKDTQKNVIAVVTVGETIATHLGRGHLVDIIGPVGDYTAEKTALLRHYCPVKHLAATNVAEAVASEDPYDTNRTTYIDADHGWTVFHIDPPGCRDIDDAIAYHAETNRWCVTIADVDAAVPVGSTNDKTAAAIGATFYDLDGVVQKPMLPTAISEGIASLFPGHQRRGVSLIVDSNKEGEGDSDCFVLTWITVQHSFTYDDTAKICSLVPSLPITTDFHTWIQDWMILYNRRAAARLQEAGTGIGIFRVQEQEQAIEQAIEQRQLQTLLGYEPSASYSLEPGYHSLGLYCHASSPLRRYVDLLNQRSLKQLLCSGSVAGSCSGSGAPDLAHLNERAKANKRWSRDLTFLTHVQPGRVQTVDIIWLTAEKVWVIAWKRILRLRHMVTNTVSSVPGSTGVIQVFCDPTQRNWKNRVMTRDVPK